jgi:uncharacterized protein (DUF433 family)
VVDLFSPAITSRCVAVSRRRSPGVLPLSGFMADSPCPDGMNWRDRIEVNTDVLTGKPVVRRTRLAVELSPELLAAGETESDLLSDYPRLTREGWLLEADSRGREFSAQGRQRPVGVQ